MKLLDVLIKDQRIDVSSHIVSIKIIHHCSYSEKEDINK